MLAWKNHTWIEVADGLAVAQIHSGLSLFETFALRDGKVECLDSHWQRLERGCAHRGIPPEQLHLGHLTKTTNWTPVLQKLLKSAALTEAIVRLVIVPKSDGTWDEWVTVRPLPATPQAVDLFLLSTRRDKAEWLPRPKSGPWENSACAWRELQTITSRSDVEGVQLDQQGHVSEATRSSLIWREGGQWYWPATSTQRLAGTAALQLIDFLGQSGEKVTEVTQPFPVQAESVLVLRSTFLGGAILASQCYDTPNNRIWQANADQTEVREILQSFARWRAQRSLKLL